MKQFLILLVSVVSFSAFASGSAPPSTLSQDITCFALPDPIDTNQPVIDVTKIEPKLFIDLQIIEQLGKITVRQIDSEKTYNGYFSGPEEGSKKGTALMPNLKTGQYEKKPVQLLKITLDTEPSPYPAIELSIPTNPEVLASNRRFGNAPYLTELKYTPDSVNGKQVTLQAVCYTSR